MPISPLTLTPLTLMPPTLMPAPPPPPSLPYLFRDDFDGTGLEALDRGAWNVEVNCDGGGNNELQCYVDSPDNIFLRDGMLHITARKESDGRVTSGRLTTQGKVEIAYGRWEARLKVPGVLGTWPAFWTLGNDIGDISWPACGEIDIMENFQRAPPDRSGEGIYSTAHSAKHSWGTNTALPGGHSKPLNLTHFHTVRMDWSPDKLEFFVNGKSTWHLDRSPGSTNYDWPYAKPHFALLNLAIGGNGIGFARPPNDAYPLTYSIDYFSIETLPPQPPAPPMLPPSPPAPPMPPWVPPCGTDSCTAATWTAAAGAYSCGERITWLQSPDGRLMDEAAACALVAAEFPAECIDCDPTANGSDNSPPSPPPSSFSPPPLSVPGTVVPLTSSCTSHPACAAIPLAGDCCPTATGVSLSCCSELPLPWSPSPPPSPPTAPMPPPSPPPPLSPMPPLSPPPPSPSPPPPSPPPPSPSPPPSSFSPPPLSVPGIVVPLTSSCNSHPACAAIPLAGDCCPTATGVSLRCCSE